MTARTLQSMCPMNCHPTLCGMRVTVEGDRLLGIEGDPDNPDSEGQLCMRGKAAHEIVGNTQRLLHPMIRDRRDGDWRRAGWDEALDLIADGMQAAGREASAIWLGHGNAVNDYGVGVKWQLVERFGNLYGCQRWNPAMICWGLGAFGLGLTGALEASTKEDMSANSELILLWAANLPSQANTARHVAAARRRGAHVVTIDIRRTEAAAQSDEALVIRPGSDTALALAMMHVIVTEGLHDQDYIARHTIGFEALADHLRRFTPDWAAHKTGLEVDQIAALARRYVATRRAMIVIGGSSLHKGASSWRAARAISCLPALTGAFGTPGGGIGPRHGSVSHGRALASISASAPRRPGTYVPAQMEEIASSLEDGRIDALLAFGSNMLSSFPDQARIERGLGRAGLVVSYDIFMNETARHFADVVLPGTIWLEEIGVKATHTHLYLADRALPPAGEARPLTEVLKGLAARLGVEDFYPWPSQEAAIDAVLDHPATGRATVAKLRASGGRAALNISHVAYPTHRYDTPSGKIEFFSERAIEMGLPPLPEPPEPAAADPAYPLALCHGRTLTHFHSFYDQGRALPTLAARDPAPQLWISPADAAARGLADGDPIRIHNARGEFRAAAKVTANMPAGAVWIRAGWAGLNALTAAEAVLPEAALDLYPFTVGQSSYAASVEVSPIP